MIGKFCMFRFGGEAEPGRAGHTSGPKLCPGVFYPRVWAKKLRAAVLELYPGYRSVECDMEEVRGAAKHRIDSMYYLDTEQHSRWDIIIRAKKMGL